MPNSFVHSANIYGELIVYQILNWTLGMKQRTRMGCSVRSRDQCSPAPRRVDEVHPGGWGWLRFTPKFVSSGGTGPGKAYLTLMCMKFSAVPLWDQNLTFTTKLLLGDAFPFAVQGSVCYNCCGGVCGWFKTWGSMVETRDGVTRRGETRNRGRKWQAFGDKVIPRAWWGRKVTGNPNLTVLAASTGLGSRNYLLLPRLSSWKSGLCLQSQSLNNGANNSSLKTFSPAIKVVFTCSIRFYS